MSTEYVLSVDISLDCLDIALRAPEGQYLLHHQAFSNNWPGYQELRQELLRLLPAGEAAVLTVAAESTGNYWWHPFYHISQDPALAPYTPRLAVLNPAHVKNFRRALPEADKADPLDPQLIGTYYRAVGVSGFHSFQERYLPLRQLTRAYSRLIHSLAAEKTFFLHLVYLLVSEYLRVKPFSNPSGVASAHFLTNYLDLAGLADLSLDDLAEIVEQSSRGHFRDARENARKLQQVARDSYPLPDFLQPTVQTLLELSLAQIRFLEGQQKVYQELIEAQLAQLPEAQLALALPGLGPILVGGCLAEIQDTRRFTSGQKYDRKKKRYRPRTYRDGQAAVARLAGLWWPGQSSGQFKSQDNRLARERNPYLRHWLVQAVVSLKRHQDDYRAYYWKKYRETTHHKHKRALILTARKATRLIFALLHKGQQQWLPEAGSEP
jgi:transposase